MTVSNWVKPTFPSDVLIVWGSNPLYQYERDWILELFRPRWIREISWFETFTPFLITPNAVVILIESARHLLEPNISQREISRQRELRDQRLILLKSVSNLIILHISDEEGLDGDEWYPSLSKKIPIFREFPHSRFDELSQINNLPLGPTRWTLINIPWKTSSQRKHPWSFMGTLWPGTSRQDALDCFKLSIPGGFDYGGSNFAQGLPLNRYLPALLDSSFALCPEGNRHFETFRFYEALQLGSIPLTLYSLEDFKRLFRHPFPLPCFLNWENAAEFAKEILQSPEELDNLQLKVGQWWATERCHHAQRLQTYADQGN